MTLVDQFIKNGYVIVKSESVTDYDYFYNAIQSVMEEKGVNGDFETLHSRVRLEDLNQLRLSAFFKLNEIERWDEKYFNMAANTLRELIGSELSIQTKLNLSIQCPHDDSSLVPLHTDRAGGHSLFEIVMWSSFTKSKESAAMYVLSPNATLEALSDLAKYETENFREFEELYAKDRVFLSVEPGDIIIFSSNIYHGNIVNITQGTRISINCRFKSLWAPEVKSYANERITGSFYKPLYISPVTQFAKMFIGKEPTFETN
jgi:sporadic carbohydrate cluster 2OG-Fe(II) oxygenase